MPMSRKVQINTCRFVTVNDLIPDSWDWFFEAVGEDAPFSWGDNNRSLVDVDTFYRHCELRILGEGYTADCAVRAWLKKVAAIPPDVYIDLEN